jgi:hypothetical protein
MIAKIRVGESSKIGEKAGTERRVGMRQGEGEWRWVEGGGRWAGGEEEGTTLGCSKVCPFFSVSFRLFSKLRREGERRVEEGASVKRVFISFLGLFSLDVISIFCSFIPSLYPSFPSHILGYSHFASWR